MDQNAERQFPEFDLGQLYGDDDTPILGRVCAVMEAYALKASWIAAMLKEMECHIRYTPVSSRRPFMIGSAKQLIDIHDSCVAMNLEMTAKQMKRVMEAIEGNLMDPNDAPNEIKQILSRLLDETRNWMLLSIDRAGLELHDKERLFGDDVFNEFPKARADITAAGTCQARGVPTAAALHLLRALELALKDFAAAMDGFDYEPKDSMEKVTKKLRNLENHLPEFPREALQRKTKIMQSRIHFEDIMNALRNPMMHSDWFWNQEQTASAIERAKLFLQDLAVIVRGLKSEAPSHP